MSNIESSGQLPINYNFEFLDSQKKIIVRRAKKAQETAPISQLTTTVNSVMERVKKSNESNKLKISGSFYTALLSIKVQTQYKINNHSRPIKWLLNQWHNSRWGIFGKIVKIEVLYANIVRPKQEKKEVLFTHAIETLHENDKEQYKKKLLAILVEYIENKKVPTDVELKTFLIKLFPGIKDESDRIKKFKDKINGYKWKLRIPGINQVLDGALPHIQVAEKDMPVTAVILKRVLETVKKEYPFLKL